MDNMLRANLIAQINRLDVSGLDTDPNVPNYAKHMIKQLDAILRVAAQLLQVAEQQNPVATLDLDAMLDAFDHDEQKSINHEQMSINQGPVMVRVDVNPNPTQHQEQHLENGFIDHANPEEMALDEEKVHNLMVQPTEASSSPSTSTWPQTPFHQSVNAAKIITDIRNGQTVANLSKKQLEELISAAEEGRISCDYVKFKAKNDDFNIILLPETTEAAIPSNEKFVQTNYLRCKHCHLLLGSKNRNRHANERCSKKKNLAKKRKTDPE